MVGFRRAARMGCLALCLCVLWGAAAAWSRTTEEENNIAVYRDSAAGVVNITSVVLQRDFFLGLVPREGAGSGAVIDKLGYILTNNHVIKDAQQIEVTLSDGSKWPGKLIGTDPDNDLAIIKIEAPSGQLKPLPMGSSSDLEVGQKVLAIGNPFGLQQTLTTGIISSVGRSIRSEEGTLIEDLIQTDAAINPGNSGGPLLDTEGRIIGVNTAIVSPSGGSVGIGFAIPVDTAKRIVPDLVKQGYVSHPWLGASLFPLVPGLADALHIKVERGALIVEVIPRGPAERAGLRGGSQVLRVGNAVLPVGGDVIVAFDGETVTSSDHLIRLIRKHRPGDRVTVRVLRENRFEEFRVTLDERPREG